MNKGHIRAPLSLNKNLQNINNNFRIHGKWIRRLGISSSFILMIFAVLAAHPIAPDDSGAEAMGTPVASVTSITMDSTQDSAELDIVPKDTNGTFAASETAQRAKFGITTNNYTGYVLTIEGSDDSQQLANVEEAVTIGTLDSINSSIDANTFNVSSSFNGKWGYQPSKYNSVANTNFLPAPTTTAATLDSTSVANPSDPNEYTIGLGAKVDYTKPAGTYTNTFVLRAVGNPTLYTINYQDMTGDTSVANLPAGASGSTSATSVVLSSQIPTRDGYTFRAWCDGTVNTTGINPGSVCTGTEFSAGGDYGVDQTSTNSSTLYAVWTPATYSLTVNFAGYPLTGVQVRTAAGTGGTLMGTVTTSGGSVSGLSYNNTYYLYPVGTNWAIFGWANNGTGTLTCAGDNCSTDGNPTFTVGMGNGEVTVTGKPVYMQDLSKSMCQTLATDAAMSMRDIRDNQDYTVRYIGGTCWMTKNLMFGYNANNPNSYTITLSPDTSNVSQSRTITVYDLEKRGTSGGECYGDYNSSTGAGSGEGYVNGCIHSGSNDYTDGNTVWYNYGAASAGSIIGGNNITIATESICPKGWTLPTVAQTRSIGPNAGSTTYISSFSPVLGGYYTNGTLYDESSYGLWWVSTAHTKGALRHLLRYIDSSLNTNNTYRYVGVYIRCVSEEKDVSDLTYMQDMTAKVVTNPKGWTLPSKDQIDTLSGGSSSSTYVPNFLPVLGGYYYNGTLNNESTHGYWWGSTAYNGAERYILLYYGSNLYTSNYYRRIGLYVRCIQAS